MPPPGRPVGHEEELSLVQHLDELRSRLIVSLVAFGLVFAICFWQADNILDIVNRPLEVAELRADDESLPDPIRESQRFDRQVAEALATTAPAISGLAEALKELSDGTGLTAGERRSLLDAADRLGPAAEDLAAAAADVPVETARRPVTLGVAEPFMTTLMVAGYAALLIVMPLLLYQLYAYILPAFRPSEREVALPLMLTVPILFMIGAVFAYFVVLPSAVGFLQTFNADNFEILIQARAYYQFSVLLMAGIGLLFQIPVGVLAITRLGILSSNELRAKRPYFILGAAVLASMVNGSPDPFTMMLVLIPLVLLFEISVRLAGWLERREAAQQTGASG